MAGFDPSMLAAMQGGDRSAIEQIMQGGMGGMAGMGAMGGMEGMQQQQLQQQLYQQQQQQQMAQQAQAAQVSPAAQAMAQQMAQGMQQMPTATTPMATGGDNTVESFILQHSLDDKAAQLLRSSPPNVQLKFMEGYARAKKPSTPVMQRATNDADQSLKMAVENFIVVQNLDQKASQLLRSSPRSVQQEVIDGYTGAQNDPLEFVTYLTNRIKKALQEGEGHGRGAMATNWNHDIVNDPNFDEATHYQAVEDFIAQHGIDMKAGQLLRAAPIPVQSRICGGLYDSALNMNAIVTSRVNKALQEGVDMGVMPVPGNSTLTPNGLRNKVCDYWLQGLCRNGNTCGYAHGKDELMTPIPDGATKQNKLCTFYPQGLCRNGDACPYLHDDADPRTGLGDLPGVDEEVVAQAADNFIIYHSLDEKASAALRSCPPRIQAQVMESYTGANNPSAFVTAAVNKALTPKGGGGGFGGGGGPGDVVPIKKTLCTLFMDSGVCKWGQCCFNAHGEEELGQPVNPQAKKTKMCAFYQQGICKNGVNCLFSHDDSDWSTPVPGRADAMKKMSLLNSLDEGNAPPEHIQAVEDFITVHDIDELAGDLLRKAPTRVQADVIGGEYDTAKNVSAIVTARVNKALNYALTPKGKGKGKDWESQSWEDQSWGGSGMGQSVEEAAISQAVENFIVFHGLDQKAGALLRSAPSVVQAEVMEGYDGNANKPSAYIMTSVNKALRMHGMTDGGTGSWDRNSGTWRDKGKGDSSWGDDSSWGGMGGGDMGGMMDGVMGEMQGMMQGMMQQMQGMMMGAMMGGGKGGGKGKGKGYSPY